MEIEEEDVVEIAGGAACGGAGGKRGISDGGGGGGKCTLTNLGRVDAMYQNVVKYGALDKRQRSFETDLAVLVSKETSLPLSIVASPWFRTLILRRDPRVVFPRRCVFTENIIPRVRKDCEEMYTTPYLKKCHGSWFTFDLWMKGGVQVDVFGINAHVIVDPCDFGAPEHIFFLESYPFSHGVSVCPPVYWQQSTLKLPYSLRYLKVGNSNYLKL